MRNSSLSALARSAAAFAACAWASAASSCSMRFEQVCGLGGPCLAERAFGGVRDGHLAEQPGQRRAEQQRDADDRGHRELDVPTPCRKDVVFVERHRDAERDAPDTLEGDPLNGTALDNGPAVRRLWLSHRGVEHRIASRRLSQRVDGRRFADEDVAGRMEHPDGADGPTSTERKNAPS